MRPVIINPTAGIDQGFIPFFPIQDTEVTREKGIVGRCAPWRTQRELIHAPYRHKLFLGGSGAGKTAVVAYAFLTAALEIQDGQGVVIAKDRSMLRDVCWKTIKELLDFWSLVNGFSFIRPGRFSDYEMKLTLINGFEIICKPADVADKFVGRNADLFWGDEPSVWPDQINLFQKIQARLRGSRYRKAGRQRGLFSTTPKGPYGIPGLFASKCTIQIRPGVFISPTPRSKTKTDGWCLIYGSTRDNLNYDASYVNNIISTMSEEMALQETEGKIIQVSGTVYSRYYHHRDSVVPFTLQPYHEIHACIDWGFNHPYAALIAHDSDARLGLVDRPVDVIFDEYVENNIPGHRAILDWLKAMKAKYKINAYKGLYPDPAGSEEVRALRGDSVLSKSPVHVYSKTSDRYTRWGVDLVCSRLLSTEGKRSLFISRELAQRPASVDPRGRGATSMFIGLRWRENKGAEVWFEDKVFDDEWLINAADGIRYYISHQYRDIGRRNWALI